MSGLTYIGELSLGAIVPGVSAQIGADVGVATGQLANATAGLTALEALVIAPPTIAASITTVTQILASLQLALSIGVPNIPIPPSAALIASLTASIAALNALLAGLVAIQAQLSAGGIFAWTYAGTGAAFGGTLTSALATTWPDSSPSSTAGNALVLATKNSATWTSMLAFFGGV
jgi:hypothetical protein